MKTAWHDLLVGTHHAGNGALRDVIGESWRRCLLGRVDPARGEAPARVEHDDLETLRAANERLIAASAPFLMQSRDQLAQTGTVMVLTDPQGVILDVEGDPHLRKAIGEFGMTPGNNWSESGIGTNAIGTALALAQPIQVHGAEHFCEPIQRWTCSASVIRDPVDGSIVGALDISGMSRDYSAHSLPLVVTTANSIENRLAQMELEERFQLLEAGVAALSAACGVALFDARGRLVKVNERAAPLLAAEGVVLTAETRIPVAGRAAADVEADRFLPARLLADRVEPVFRGRRLLGYVVSLPEPAVRAPVIDEVAAAVRALSPSPTIVVAEAAAARTMGGTGGRAGEAVMVTDVRGRIVTVNEAFSAMTGYGAEDLVGKPASVLNSGRHSRAFFQRMWRNLLEEGCWEGEIENLCRDGGIRPSWLTIHVVKGVGGDVQGYTGIFGDRDAVGDLQRRLAFLTTHDGLTGLANRKLLTQRLADALAQDRSPPADVAVLLINLDNFKDINDTLGHDFGDLLLEQVADRLRRCLADAHTLARIGGDEFAVIVKGRSVEDLRALVARTLDYLGASFCIEGHDVFAAASIGIAVSPTDGDTTSALLTHADTALHEAKALGRNRFRFFAAGMQDLVRARMSIGTGLRAAIEGDRFRVVYQPQYRLDAGRLVGAEALVRWHDPELGDVPPSRFIPAAEEAGLIVSINDIVMAKVLAQIALWRMRGLAPPRISINVAAQQLREPGFVEQLCRRLDERAVPAGAICLELTEGTLLEDIDGTARMFERLARHGIAVSIDDFGTGYSSLSYLNRLPVHELKVDQSFVQGIASEAGKRSIIVAIVEMAHALGIEVLAEGIETESQLAFLRERRCEMGQGYLFHRPLGVDAFEKLMVV
ncbi:EAL domain-containing protein [Aromatoleum toluolicum]|uniref:EAL domain-containing protein n=1 Tax=Aromatoleum toluolicum TaxID=90060 RepID=A0ABX1N9V4_9RHOO|nr:EAL domain-containing protein [Aromatoleum toluolicum]NMF96063.1 EAL domain-containing protein [Aromatoleum toluolicum]